MLAPSVWTSCLSGVGCGWRWSTAHMTNYCLLIVLKGCLVYSESFSWDITIVNNMPNFCWALSLKCVSVLSLNSSVEHCYFDSGELQKWTFGFSGLLINEDLINNSCYCYIWPQQIRSSHMVLRARHFYRELTTCFLLSRHPPNVSYPNASCDLFLPMSIC